jgi:hypothetical protein
LKKADLHTIAQHVLTCAPYNRLPLLAKRHKLEVEKSSASPVEVLQKHISRCGENGLCRLLLEISLLESAYRAGVLERSRRELWGHDSAIMNQFCGTKLAASG